ncbi:hypothetical protein VPH35_072727 [Triticum aestivum]
MVAPSKPRKALPKIKMYVPVASAAVTSATSMDIYKDQDDEETEDATLLERSCAAPQDVIELRNDDEDVPQKTTGRKDRTSSRRAPASCWKYALEAIIKWLLLYFLVHDNCLLFML